jgi:hypothetical protein
VKNLVQDLKDVIIEITDVKKRVEDLKLKIELSVGSSREPYRSWHNELNTIIKDLERILR